MIVSIVGLLLPQTETRGARRSGRDGGGRDRAPTHRRAHRRAEEADQGDAGGAQVQ